MRRIGNVGDPEKGEPQSQEDPRKPLLLCVEDDPPNQLVARCKLARKYEILMASNASEACHLLVSRGQQISVILMDIELKESELNGIQLAKLIRGKLERSALPRYAQDVPVLDTPIVFVTAYGTKYDVGEMLDCGAKVVDKPVDFIELELCLTKLKLRKHR